MRHTDTVQSQLSHEWSTPTGLVVTGWILAAAATLWLVLADGAVDRLFIGVIVLVLAAVASYASVVRPRLIADTNGVAVRGLRSTRHWAWSDVTVRVQRSNRLGRTVETLELDVPDDELIVLTKLDLGVDPHDVAATLRSLRT